MAETFNLQVKVDEVANVVERVRTLTGNTILIGIPSTTAGRTDTPIDNASIGYINEFGSPAQNIPARPFLRPGVQDAIPVVLPMLRKVAEGAFSKSRDKSIQAMHRIGITTASAVRRRVTTGPFTPLADATVAARARRGRKGAIEEMKRRAAGKAAGTNLAKPLIDTGALRRSITYVLRGKWF